MSRSAVALRSRAVGVARRTPQADRRTAMPQPQSASGGRTCVKGIRNRASVWAGVRLPDSHSGYRGAELDASPVTIASLQRSPSDAARSGSPGFFANPRDITVAASPLSSEFSLLKRPGPPSGCHRAVPPGPRPCRKPVSLTFPPNFIWPQHERPKLVVYLRRIGWDAGRVPRLL